MNANISKIGEFLPTAHFILSLNSKMKTMSQEVYLIDGIRSAIGNFGGSLATLRADDLAAKVLAGLLKDFIDGLPGLLYFLGR